MTVAAEDLIKSEDDVMVVTAQAGVLVSFLGSA